MTTTTQPLRTTPQSDCFLCGSSGAILYADLTDRRLQVTGAWQARRCPRAECGLVWLDPRPVAEDIAKIYDDYYAHEEPSKNTGRLRQMYAAVQRAYWSRHFGYAGSAPWLAFLAYLNPGRREEMDSAVMYLSAQQNTRLLEIGCGSGARLQLLRELGWNAEGIETDPVAVKRCIERGLPVKHGMLHEQQFAAGTFDVVIMNHVIEHVIDPQALLEEIRRVLVPGGKLVVTTPNIASWAHRRFRGNWVALDPPRHLHLFNLQTLQQLVRRAGFVVRNARTTIRGAAWVFLASHAIQKHGKFSLTATGSRPRRLWGRAMELVEFFMLKIDPQAGEQITLIAEAP